MAENDATGNTSEPLTPKQQALIALLIAGVKVPAAAQQLQLKERTAYRWLQSTHVKAAYQQAQRDVFEDALSELRSGVGTAIACLKRHMTSEDTKPYTQVHAAEVWLTHAVELFKMTELERKVAELERILKEGA